MLYQRGVFLNRCFDYVCIEQPEIVRAIHDEYLMAGSEIITTNSFGANRIKLEKHGLADRIEDINRAAVQIARDAAVGRALVAGDVGPTGVGLSGLAGESGVKARAAFREQIEILVDAGVDAICLETFDVVQELESPSRYRKRSAICGHRRLHVSEGSTAKHSGLKPEQVARRLVDAGADVVRRTAEGDQSTYLLLRNYGGLWSPCHRHGQCRSSGIDRRADHLRGQSRVFRRFRPSTLESGHHHDWGVRNPPESYQADGEYRSHDACQRRKCSDRTQLPRTAESALQTNRRAKPIGSRFGHGPIRDQCRTQSTR